MNVFNLASHTIALKQSVLGKPHLFVLVHQPWTVLQPPTVCGKRSRSSSGASSSLSSSRRSLSADGHKNPFVNCLVAHLTCSLAQLLA
ncbi:uncharacterized protein UMAG_10486 [Mycosarcoma maydis]|uniref:Uncharacterized protein n=1 Tax=Mycosarcoma maydis TaxID=5270 RepID=A0A0D1E033_MYCMD|nr:uncharacterized protein UMAG_10486 [Ustilago maydis 521]KIS68105.1 hypothetical protein UMAG_10486 [Ustilago maydis 521]|eukprot:XP_011390310.1 hypothetical protein UMAG_10486 [Ustilago maydis 521]